MSIHQTEKLKVHSNFWENKQTEKTVSMQFQQHIIMFLLTNY